MDDALTATMIVQNEERNRKETDDFSASKNGNVRNKNTAEVEVQLFSPGKTHADQLTRLMSFDEEKIGDNVAIEATQPFLYNLYQNPPFLLTIMFACQQAMISISAPLTHVLVACELTCSQEDDALKVQLLSASTFMVGLASFSMCMFGVRLPIFQGPAAFYLFPLLALKGIDEWKCPPTFKALDPTTNTTILMADMGNGTFIPNREFALGKLSVISGSLVAAGVLHFVLGISGLVGIFTRYIGPVTIVPSVALTGIQMYRVYVNFSQSDWTTSVLVTACCLILSLYLANLNTPVPKWRKRRGFYIEWQPIHQVFSILFTLIFGCILSAILTAANFYSDDPGNKGYLARINSRSSIISETKWFIFPYPGQFGPPSFSVGLFLSFVVATLSSVLDSIGDYAACARIVQVSPPPPYAFNRGLFVEGVMSTLSGFFGCCHGTASYGVNMGAMKITKVTSLRVLQVTGLIYIILAIFGKVGAVFVAIPNPVLGGVMLVTTGIFIGMLISCLQLIDLNSTRNVAIIGMTLIWGLLFHTGLPQPQQLIDLNSTRNVAIIGMTLVLGFAIPHWVTTSPDGVQTGSKDFDEIIRMLLSNPTFVGGVFAAFLDNTIPGTWKERGLLHQMEDLSGKATHDKPRTKDGTNIYRLPFLPDSFRRSRFAKHVPIFDVSEVDPK